jgi:hypothetical protein
MILDYATLKVFRADGSAIYSVSAESAGRAEQRCRAAVRGV